MRGGCSTLFRDVFYGVYFWSYEGIRRTLLDILDPLPLQSQSLTAQTTLKEHAPWASTVAVLGAGGVAGIVGCVSSSMVACSSLVVPALMDGWVYVFKVLFPILIDQPTR